MKHTAAEKIISRHCMQKVRAGDYVVVNIDFAMGSDTTMPFAIDAFNRMGGTHLIDPKRFAVVIDHATPAPNQKIANIHRLLRDFATKEQCLLFDAGDGICHQLVLEGGYVHAGDLIFGADSHTCTYGAVGALSIGVGSTDLAAVMITGKNWLLVPESIKVLFHGGLTPGVTAKDVILYMIGKLKSDGATYRVIEYIDMNNCFDQEQRMTICNMSVEMGAKGGLFPEEEYKGDTDATYIEEFHIDLTTIEPQISCPHSVDQVTRVIEVEGKKVDQVFIGSCTNGRYSDLERASALIKGKTVASGTRLYIAPASRKVLVQAIASGVISDLISAGAILLPPGCGPCVGTLGGIPGDGETVLSTSNRNFLGRMGNSKSSIYLCSPETAIVSAIRGKISDPRK